MPTLHSRVCFMIHYQQVVTSATFNDLPSFIKAIIATRFFFYLKNLPTCCDEFCTVFVRSTQNIITDNLTGCQNLQLFTSFYKAKFTKQKYCIKRIDFKFNAMITLNALNVSSNWPAIIQNLLLRKYVHDRRLCKSGFPVNGYDVVATGYVYLEIGGGWSRDDCLLRNLRVSLRLPSLIWSKWQQ